MSVLHEQVDPSIHGDGLEMKGDAPRDDRLVPMIPQLCKERIQYVPAAMASRWQVFCQPSFPACCLILALHMGYLSKYCKKAEMLFATSLICTPAAQHARLSARHNQKRKPHATAVASARTCPQVHAARQVIGILPPAREFCCQRHIGLLLCVLPAPEASTLDVRCRAVASSLSCRKMRTGCGRCRAYGL